MSRQFITPCSPSRTMARTPSPPDGGLVILDRSARRDPKDAGNPAQDISRIQDHEYLT